ncbi:MAG: hypothetical protein QM755_15840 [Luteolibacter sp.]
MWRKLGGGSLSISLMVHALLLALGVFWIFQVIPEKKPDVNFMPQGGGGGSPGVKEISNKKQRATMSTPNTPRMAAKGATSSFTLPEPDAASSMSSLGSLSAGGLSGGLGGSGSGGGRGDGHGKGFGSGSGLGLGGSAAGLNPFGMISPNANAMVGVFYDTKQDAKHHDTGMTPEKLVDLIGDFSRGWNELLLEGRYYQAPQKLYQTKLYIPVMPADGAPKAFNCEKEVQPSRWVVIYRGNVTPPKSGKYRFVGAGDDVLMVRFNRRTVLDWGYISGTTGLHRTKISPVLAGTSTDKDAERRVRSEFPTKTNTTFYTYASTSIWNRELNGLACGAEFDAIAGNSYPIEILISEVPGGKFGAALLIEEIGATYRKDSTGSPILPLFRLDNNQPAANAPEAPPFDPQGAPWKLVTNGTRDI